MKKNVLFIASIFITFAHGMEKKKLDKLDIVPCLTQICLIQGSIFDADVKRGFMVVGRKQQEMLRKTNPAMALTYYLNNQVVYVKNNDNGFVERKIVQSTVLNVIEPKIKQCAYLDQNGMLDEMYSAYTRKHSHYPKYTWSKELFLKDQAIIEALRDLTLCYRIVLFEGAQKAGEVEEKSIAIPTLSTELGIGYKEAAAIAVKAVVEFVNQYPTAYSCIDLFVNGTYEFDEYHALLFLYECGDLKPELWL